MAETSSRQPLERSARACRGARSGGRAPWPILVALFVAGFSGLVYEVAWTRILTLTFGGTVIAAAAVLCAFMGGLALGSWASGRWADTGRSRALAVAAVQLAMGATALALMLIFPQLTAGYVWVDRALRPTYYTLSAIRFTFSVLVLLVPAALIAAVFPLVARLVVSSRNRVGAGIALVYGIDTMGAVAGAAVAGFVLLRWLGVAHAVHIAAALNCAAAALAFVSRGHESTPQAWSVSAAAEAEQAPVSAAAAPPDPGPAPLTAGATRLLSISFGISGAAALCYEILTTKALVHVLTMSFDAFCIMLSCFLFGLGAGSLICMALLRRPRPVLFWFGVAEAGIGVLGLSLPLQFQGVPHLLRYMRVSGYSQWSGQLAGSVATLLPMTLLMGATLPLVVTALTPSLRRLGRSAGTLYSVNTLGGVAGVLTTTFVLLPFAGFKTGMTAAACLNLAVAFIAFHYSRDIPARRRWATALSALGLAALLFPLSTQSSLKSALLWVPLREAGEPKVLFYEEGEYGTVAVTSTRDPRVGFTHQLYVSASGEGGSDLASLRAFQLLGNLPFLLHGDHSRPKDVLVCAFGMGITLGIAGDQDSRSVDCVELVPEVLEASPFFFPYNHDPLHNPKVTAHLEDARNFLLATPRKFDIVIMDATHPRSGDSWMLYTQECYRLAKRALAPGGVCAQWVPCHSLSSASFWSIVNTFQSVFPHTTLWSPPGSVHTVLVGTPDPARIDFAYLDSRLRDPAVRRNLEAAEIPDVYTFLSYFVAGEQTLARKASRFPLNTDDLSPVQFDRKAAPVTERNQIFADLAESPVGMISDWSATPGALADQQSQRVERAFEAARLIRQWTARGERVWDPLLLERVYALNPNDRDAAIQLGLAQPRLRAEDNAPIATKPPRVER